MHFFASRRGSIILFSMAQHVLISLPVRPVYAERLIDGYQVELHIKRTNELTELSCECAVRSILPQIDAVCSRSVDDVSMCRTNTYLVKTV